METSVLDTDTALTANSDAKVATQKAVKAYVDGVGVANATTTVRGLVEESTDAQVVAGTDTGETGARLFVPPSKLNTQIDTKISAYIQSFQQNIGTSVTETLDANGYLKAAGSNSDGSVLIVTFSGTTDALYRFERDAGTGQYLQTHRVTISASGQFNTSTHGSVIVIGSYAYLFSIPASGNIYCYRYDLATLANETTITVPVVAASNYVVAWTDGTNAYIISSSTATTSRTWTLSGTTFSASSTATVTSPMTTISLNYSTFWDGSNAYICGTDSATTYTFYIRKLTAINASTFSETTKIYPRLSDNERQFIACSIDSSRMYIGGISNIYDEAAIIGSQLRLVPVTKP
jgi:hypothetical protein